MSPDPLDSDTAYFAPPRLTSVVFMQACSQDFRAQLDLVGDHRLRAQPRIFKLL